MSYFDIEMPSNFILSGYGRNKVQNYVATAKTENRILYANKKSQKLKNTPGVQFADNILTSDYGNNLSQLKEIVKSNIQFARLLQEKSAIDANGLTKNNLEKLGKSESSADYQKTSNDNEDLSERDLEADSKQSDRKSTQPESKFSMRDSVEEAQDHIAFYNITESLLMDVLNRNSLLMPSLAVTNKGMTDFGDVSLLFDKRTIDPNANKENKLYGADAWTPTQTQLCN